MADSERKGRGMCGKESQGVQGLGRPAAPASSHSEGEGPSQQTVNGGVAMWVCSGPPLLEGQPGWERTEKQERSGNAESYHPLWCRLQSVPLG